MRGGLALPVLLLLVAGCVSPAATPEGVQAASVAGVDAEGFAPVLFDDVLFQEVDLGVVDGLRLHADVYLPDGPKAADAPTKYPTVLLLSPYWGGGTHGEPIGYMPYDFLVQRLLPRGYAVVFGDLGGNGGSSGCWDFMGPQERKSAYAMVEAIAEQEWSDGKVGMMGLSYDGMTQIMAASDQAPHLVTVIPASALTEAYNGLIMNGVHYGGGWHQTITGYESASLMGPGPTATPRAQGWAETIAASPTCLADNHAGSLPTNEYNAYYQARDFRELGKDVKASVFVTQGFLDGAVKPNNHGAWFDHVPTQKKAWLGFWSHQYPTAENAGRDDMYLTLHRWLDHELKGIDNGIDREPAIDVQDSLGRWRREDAWPPADAAPTAYPLEGVSFGGAASALDLVATDSSAVAFTLVAEDGMHIAGRPVVDLRIASDRPAGMVVARLFDEDRMVTQGAFNLLFAGGLETAQPLTPGEAVDVSFELYPTDWAVLPGHMLTLYLFTQDRDMWFDPDAGGATLTVEAGEGSMLTLPTIERADDAFFLTSCGEWMEDEVGGCWLDLEDQGVEADD